jgi:TonB family protein
MRLARVLLVIALLPALAPAEDNPARLGEQAVNGGAYTTAVYFLKPAVNSDPRHPSAWNDLCRAYLALDRLDDAIDACFKQIDVNPQIAGVYGTLGAAQWRKGKHDDAISTFQQHVEVEPQNGGAHATLGHYYCELEKYAQAVPELEKAVALEPNNTTAQADLGGAYLSLGQIEKGLAMLQKLAQDHPTLAVLNRVAFKLTAQKTALDLAQQYAQSAVSAAAARLPQTPSNPITVETLRRVSMLANCWDTLGYIYFQQADLDEANKFIAAAWSLDSEGRIAEHRRKIGAGVDRPAAVTPAGKLSPEKASADFYVLQAPKPANPEAQFIRGDESLRPFAKTVADLTPAFVFPDAIPAKLIRRVTLTCPGHNAECSFELQPASAAVFAELNAVPPDTHFTSESGVSRIGSGVTPPVPFYRPPPEYSKQARKKRVQGTVMLSIVVDRSGHPRDIKVIRSLGMGLDEKAIEAVSHWEFHPGMKDGQPVLVQATIEVNFRLLDNP